MLVATPAVRHGSVQLIGGFGGNADRVVVGGHVLAAGVDQDQSRGALRLGGGEQHAHRAGVVGGHDGGTLAACVLHDTFELLDERLPGRQGVEGQRIGGARAPPVEPDEPGERGEPSEEKLCLRVLPVRINSTEAARGQDQVDRRFRVGGYDFVGDPIRAESCIAGRALHEPRIEL